jgi:hypothetical protein
MAQIQNPKKQFNFGILIPGMNEFLAQKVTLPDFEIEEVLHGDFNFDVKTGGRAKFGRLIMEKLSRADQNDSLIWNYLRSIQNVYTGGGMLPSMYKSTLEVYHYAPDGITVLDIYRYEGAWPCKLNGIELNRSQSENTIESIEWCVDQPDKVL